MSFLPPNCDSVKALKKKIQLKELKEGSNNYNKNTTATEKL